MAAKQVQHSVAIAEVVLQIQEVLLPQVLVVALRQQRSLVDGGYLIVVPRFLNVPQVLSPNGYRRLPVRPVLLVNQLYSTTMRTFCSKTCLAVCSFMLSCDRAVKCLNSCSFNLASSLISTVTVGLNDPLLFANGQQVRKWESTDPTFGLFDQLGYVVDWKL